MGVIQVLFTATAALIMDRAGRRLLLTLSGEAPGGWLCPLHDGEPPTAGWRAFAEVSTLWEENKG